MNKSIKTKDKIKDIKTADRKQHLHHFVKKASMKSKDKQSDDLEQSQNSYATTQVTKQEKNTAIQTYQKGKQLYIKSKSKSIKNKKSEEINAGTETNHIREKKNTIDFKQIENKKTDGKVNIKSKRYKKTHFASANHNQLNSQYQMKAFHIKKHQQKATDTKKNVHVLKQKISHVKSGMTKSYQMIRKTGKGVQFLMSAGTGVLLIITIALFFGVFGALADDSGINSSIEPLSNEVLSYTTVIEKYATQYDMSEYIPIIQAVMMQESGGKGTDPMQASECPYNTKYPKKPNAIQESEYSIDIGIHYLSDCFKEAQVKDTFDNEHIFLALQGYNYGNGYIEWAVKNFGGYSKANAKVFSDQKKAELGWDTYGDPDYIEHVMRYVSLGFGNYRDQPDFGNMEAWGTSNPYSRAKLYGQCTWFAWGRFYEIYGYSPGFIGDGYKCANQLVAAHPDRFVISDTPAVGAVFSTINRNHTGIVIGWDGKNITIQEGNLDGGTNTFEEAKKDWHTRTYTFEEFKKVCRGVIFANPI